jgi:hypothetical protein
LSALRRREPIRRVPVAGLGPENRFRIFYQVKTDTREVRILAIGVKDRNRLYFGGKEFEE